MWPAITARGISSSGIDFALGLAAASRLALACPSSYYYYYYWRNSKLWNNCNNDRFNPCELHPCAAQTAVRNAGPTHRRESVNGEFRCRCRQRRRRILISRDEAAVCPWPPYPTTTKITRCVVSKHAAGPDVKCHRVGRQLHRLIPNTQQLHN